MCIICRKMFRIRNFGTCTGSVLTWLVNLDRFRLNMVYHHQRMHLFIWLVGSLRRLKLQSLLSLGFIVGSSNWCTSWRRTFCFGFWFRTTFGAGSRFCCTFFRSRWLRRFGSGLFSHENKSPNCKLHRFEKNMYQYITDNILIFIKTYICFTIISKIICFWKSDAETQGWYEFERTHFGRRSFKQLFLQQTKQYQIDDQCSNRTFSTKTLCDMLKV